jgi:protein arginine N-methyltransferase 1
MIRDEGRMGPYVRALTVRVRPGSVVADIGTGTGILALVACRLGASRVYAIDTNDAVEVGRELARENGFEDRIVFIQKDARQVELPEPANIIVSDLRGPSPLCGEHLAIIADVRSRFLKPGGALIPATDRLLVAVVDALDMYEWAVGPATGPMGITLERMRERLRQGTCVDRGDRPLQAANVISTSAPWATIDYATVQPAPVAGHADLRVERAGTGHGLVVWFETVLADGHGFTTAPGQELCYGRLFLPWERPVKLHAGDIVSADLWAQPSGEPWGWNTSIRTDQVMRESFKQSSFIGFPGRLEPRASTLGRKGVLSQTTQS